MTHKHSIFGFAAILAIVLGASVLMAQVASTGGVLGTVTDPTGAVVPSATVTLTNIDTGITSSAPTNETGNYTFPLVPVGRYQLAVEKPGFKKFLQSGFVVNAAQNVRLNASLSVGTVTEAVTTTAEPPAVDTVTANQGNTVSGQQATTLPLTNRVFTQLVMLEPGVAAPLDQSPGFGSNSQVLFNMNGVRSDENNLTIDGLRNLDTFGGNAFIAPNLFAVSEFRVENNSYSATTGRNGGGQVNLVTRSGTNAFHGNVFEFFRNDALNAKDYFATSVPENRYNDFGYDVGGPIKKDRIFFFWSQEWRRIIQSAGTQLALVPTAAERAGDFSALLQGSSPVMLTNPATGQPYPGNIIPASEIDPNASLLLQTYFPMPLPGFQQGVFNFVSSAPDFTRWREESIRVDGKITDKLSAYVRLTQDSATLENPYGLFHENSLPNVGGSTQNYPIYSGITHFTYTPHPSLIAEFTWGIYRDNDNFLQNGPLSSRARASGLNIPQIFPLNELDRIPSLNISGYAGVIEEWYFHNYSYSMPFDFASTWLRGRHMLRFGLDWTREGKSELANPSNNNTNGTFTFTGQYTGDGLADFLTGRANDYTETALDPFFNYRWYDAEPYVEDQIKLRPNLTLTAGLRYTYYQPERETSNHFVSFSQQKWNPAQAPLVNPDGTLVPGTGNPLNGIIIAGQNSPYGPALFPSHKNAFAPRIGLAWDPTNSGKMSVRAGYGIFYDRWGSFSQFGAYNPPINQTVNIFNTLLSNPSGATGSSSPLFPPTLSGVLPPWKYPTVHKWSVSIQREVAADTSASVAYVGTHGSHLLGPVDVNQPYPTLAVAQGNISPDAVRPNSGFSSITMYGTMFNSSYNALQATIQHRLRHGLQFQASYTWSKTLTDASSAWSTPPDSHNLKAERGLASFDIPQVLVLSYAYDLPVFQHSTGVTKAFLGGWQLSGITTIQSGFPFTVTIPVDQAGVGTFNQRANIVGDPNGPKTVTQWFNTQAFTTPALLTFGNSRNGAVRGPGINNWDFALGKSFAWGEGRDVRLRGEFFNLPNHPSFNYLDSTVGDAAFGQLTSSYAPRIVQLSLVLTF